MVEYLQALNAVRDTLNRYPEVKQLIKYELNQQEDAQYVDFHENQPEAIPGTPIGSSTHGTVSHETRAGNVHDRSTCDVQSTEAVEPEAVNPCSCKTDNGVCLKCVLTKDVN